MHADWTFPGWSVVETQIIKFEMKIDTKRVGVEWQLNGRKLPLTDSDILDLELSRVDIYRSCILAPTAFLATTIPIKFVLVAKAFRPSQKVSNFNKSAVYNGNEAEFSQRLHLMGFKLHH